MADPALRRTIRRCTAVMLLPLSFVPIVFVTWIEERGATHYAGVGTLLSDLSWLFVIGAVLYLFGSGLAGLNTDADAGTEPAE